MYLVTFYCYLLLADIDKDDPCQVLFGPDTGTTFFHRFRGDGGVRVSCPSI